MLLTRFIYHHSPSFSSSFPLILFATPTEERMLVLMLIIIPSILYLFFCDLIYVELAVLAQPCCELLSSDNGLCGEDLGGILGFKTQRLIKILGTEM